MFEKMTKTFSNGWVSVLHVEDEKGIHPLEITSTCLPLSTELRGGPNKTSNIVEDVAQQESYDFWGEKWMIGVSTQSGCPIKCKFCATGKITEKYGWYNLSGQQIMAQVEYAVMKTGKDPANSKLFRVLFTRMGEPSLNIQGVIDGILLIKHKYPNARIQISSIGLPATEQLVEDLMVCERQYPGDWLELQLSVHSTDLEYRQWLQTPNVLPAENIRRMCARFYEAKPRKWKVTLNFALAKDTPFDVKKLKKDFDPKHVFIKISPINENCVSDDNSIKSLFNYENNI